MPLPVASIVELALKALAAIMPKPKRPAKWVPIPPPPPSPRKDKK